MQIIAITSFLFGDKIDLLKSTSPLNNTKRWNRTVGIESVYQIPEERIYTGISKFCELHLERFLNSNEQKISDISVIQVNTQTPDRLFPQMSNLIQSHIGANEETICIDTKFGCGGMPQSTQVMESLLKENETGLLIIGDITSKTTERNEQSRYLFSDSLSFVLLRKNHPSHSEVYSFGNLANCIIAPNSGFAQENGNGNLLMNGPDVFSFATTLVPQYFKKNSTERQKEVVLHQANQMINSSIESKLSDYRFISSLATFGNTSCNSIPLTLSYNNQNEFVTAVGFGVGATIAIANYDCSNTQYKIEYYASF